MAYWELGKGCFLQLMAKMELLGYPMVSTPVYIYESRTLSEEMLSPTLPYLPHVGLYCTKMESVILSHFSPAMDPKV